MSANQEPGPLLKDVRGKTRKEQDELLNRISERVKVERDAERQNLYFGYYSEVDAQLGRVKTHAGTHPVVTLISEYYRPEGGGKWGEYKGLVKGPFGP